jgi:integrase/recombinase XerD
VRTRIVCLERAISVIDPSAPREVYKAICTRFSNKAPPLQKRQRMQGARTLVTFGIKVMEEARLDPADTRARSLRYRTGLQIALLAARPLRRKNFTSLRLGTHLQEVQGQWRIMIEGTETKNGKPIDVPFPPMLVGYLVHYLTSIRSRLLKTSTDALWISQFGGPQPGGCIYGNIHRWTGDEYGQPINLHLFRDCAATSIAIDDSANINIVSSVLGHSNLTTSQRYYNQAQSIDASRKFNGAMQSLRRQLKSSHTVQTAIRS